MLSVGNFSIHHCGKHAHVTRLLAPAAVVLVVMGRIVILSTSFATLLQHAVSFHVRIAVVAIRTLDGHAQGGDNYSQHEKSEDGEG